MIARFTPGPWAKDRLGQLRGIDGEQVAVWGAGIAWADRSPATEANALLIATAPEMYEILDEAADFIQPFNRADALLGKIEAVLAKARGEQS